MCVCMYVCVCVCVCMCIKSKSRPRLCKECVFGSAKQIFNTILDTLQVLKIYKSIHIHDIHVIVISFFVCMCVCVYIYIYIYIYMHNLIHSHVHDMYISVYRPYLWSAPCFLLAGSTSASELHTHTYRHTYIHTRKHTFIPVLPSSSKHVSTVFTEAEPAWRSRTTNHDPLNAASLMAVTICSAPP
jgi:hypothetical protein